MPGTVPDKVVHFDESLGEQEDINTLNVRADYRRPLGPVDIIAFLDVLNVLGSSASDEREFNSATGELKLDDEGPTPLIGIRFEKTWQ